MKSLNLENSHDNQADDVEDEIEDIRVFEDKNNKNFDGEIDEDITYEMGEHPPIERE